MPGRAIKATRLSNRLQPRATRSLRTSLVHSLDQSPVHGGTVNKELLRTVTNTTRAAQQGAWATRFDLPPAPPCASGAFGMDTTRAALCQRKFLRSDAASGWSNWLCLDWESFCYVLYAGNYASFSLILQAIAQPACSGGGDTCNTSTPRFGVLDPSQRAARKDACAALSTRPVPRHGSF